MRPIDVIEGKVSVLDRADVDTDQIIPKQFLKRVERTGFGEFLFYDWIRDGEIELEPNPILVAGRNFGCGSSREHAPWALEDFGFEAIVAPSFADIFYSNCTKIGLLPAILDEEHCRAVAEAGEARIDVDDETVTCAAGVFEFEVEPDVKHRLLNGLDDIGITLENAARSTPSRPAAPAPAGHDGALSGDDEPAMNTGAARVGRRDLRPRLRPPVQLGHGGPRPARAARRRDRARRRLRLRPRHRASCSSACPTGSVIAVDGSEAMVEKARERLGDRASAISSPTSPSSSSPSRSTLVFSTATFHWILDHERSSRACARRCGPAAGWSPSAAARATSPSYAQAIADGRAREPEYAAHFERAATEIWNFAAPEETEARLRAAGFAEVALLAASPSRSRRTEPLRVHRRPSPSARTWRALPEELRRPFAEASSRSSDAAADARLRPPQHRGRAPALTA